MSKTNQAADPSMEEILASIRRIISDDEAPADPPPAKSGPVPVPDEEPENSNVDIDAMMADMDAEKEAEDDDFDFDSMDFDAAGAEDETEDEAEDEDIFELTEVVEEPEDSLNDSGLVTVEDQDLCFGDDAAPEPAPEPEPVKASPQPAENDRLLSPGRAADASAAFGVLADTILSTSGNSRTLEDLVKELLRPILKEWLDDNLPELVERLVRDEIERVARGGR
ncbi:MAG: DUF2497 domain-containing protein [Hyphomicrobiales bacterium]|nr:MAG: DUF2497 domain-containing protein [Hyphomicrobiales bacterium]